MAYIFIHIVSIDGPRELPHFAFLTICFYNSTASTALWWAAAATMINMTKLFPCPDSYYTTPIYYTGHAYCPAFLDVNPAFVGTHF